MECKVLGDDEKMDVLYGEANAETEARVLAHQQGCAACREELASLRRVRRDLTHWNAPALGRAPEAPRPAPGLVPRWAAAAAVLLLAAGGAFGLSGGELRVAEGHLTFRMGRPSSGSAEIEVALAAERARQAHEIEALRASFAAQSVPARDDDALLRRVQQMIRESEAQQSVLLAATMADFEYRAGTQSRADLARVGAFLDNQGARQLAQTSKLMATVLKASQQR